LININWLPRCPPQAMFCTTGHFPPIHYT
jgi:hypothetical protein